ncbi:GNAT family N-acetyltransferase [Leisingera sp. JC1]|uniref:GNAT family N-acetyltransferase n=1 Tax=Leisingera sp. JC1 TaxID=1855282 RepID=UPI0020C7969B|nr:GNAT family N-acetyltransferase [Leisingera sp. JC1]
MGEIPVLCGSEGAAEFNRILALPGTSIAVAEAGGQVVSAATLHVLPNLTHGGRPYALIENVVTLRAFQSRGFGRAVMNFARDRAWAMDAYKIMLLTGKAAGVRGFYERLGYTGDDKHAMTLRRSPARQPQPGNLPQ